VPQSHLDASVTTLKVDSSVTGLKLVVEPLESETTSVGVTTVTLSSDVLFEFGKATLTPTAQSKIAQIATRLAAARGTVTVVGHTDAIGSLQDNQALSSARASAVRAALLQGLAGKPLQIAASGVGETQPVAPDMLGGKDNPAGRALNRRVVITFR